MLFPASLFHNIICYNIIQYKLKVNSHFFNIWYTLLGKYNNIGIGIKENMKNILYKQKKKLSCLILSTVLITACILPLTGCGTELTLTTPISITDYKLNTYVQISSYTNVNKSIILEAISLCDHYEHIFHGLLQRANCIRSTIKKHQ